GGGAFSGKDATKVDRSASYAARYVAKNLVAAGVASKVELQLAYAIGVSEPTSISLNTFGTSSYSVDVIIKIIRDTFDLSSSCIISMKLHRRPIYAGKAAYVRYGNTELDLPREDLDEFELIQSQLN